MTLAGRMACCERLRKYAGGLHRQSGLIETRCRSFKRRIFISTVDYVASARHNVSGGSSHAPGQIDGSHQRGAKMEQSGKSVPFRCENQKEG